jgi:hypothetical protein
MAATGIPPHLVHAARVKGINRELERVKSTLYSLPSLMTNKVVEDLLNTFAIEGTLPLTVRNVDLRL